MKITPIEIRQHTFDKAMRGYRTEDVDAFLSSLSQEWERVTGDFKMLKMQLELAEKELGKLKEVEMTLFRTLKTAEDTSAQITEQANNAGEKYVNDAKQKADDIMADARKRSAIMVQDAENQARYLKDNILNDLKSLEHDFKALEGYKENLASQIRTLASNAVDSVDRFEKKFAKQNLKGKIDEVASQIKDELNETAAGDQLTNNPEATPETLKQTDSVDNLPPLVERETAIPEAIPMDETVEEKPDETLQPTTQPEAAQESAIDAEHAIEQTTSGTASISADTAEPVADSAEEPQEVPTKKSGSFFDQI